MRGSWEKVMRPVSRRSLVAEARRPGGKTNGGPARQLTRPAGLDVEHPELPCPGASRDEGDVATIRCPRWILVASVARELPDASVAEVDREDLKATPDHRLERHQPTIGRPIRTRPVPILTERQWREQVDVRAVGIHRVDLRMAGATRHERDASTVGAEAW